MTQAGQSGAGRFVGQSVKRREDPRLTTGRGRYVDDVVLPRQFHAAFVRSPIARGNLLSVETSEARNLSGVVAVYTAEDLHPLAHSYWMSMMGPDGGGPVMRALAERDVRYVGEPIAIVIADSRYRAEDGAELIDVAIEAQPAVVTMEQALTNEILVHPEFPTNESAIIAPVENRDLEAAFSDAAHVYHETFEQHRYLCVPMECRGINVSWDPWRERMEIIAATQTAHEVRAAASRLLDLPEDHIHVVMPDVGGSFGQKMFPAREEFAVILAAKKLGRPVKWTEDRQENLVAGGHSREESIGTSFALDDEGHILAMRAHHVENVGAYPNLSNGAVAPSSAVMYPGPYELPTSCLYGPGCLLQHRRTLCLSGTVADGDRRP